MSAAASSLTVMLRLGRGPRRVAIIVFAVVLTGVIGVGDSPRLVDASGGGLEKVHLRYFKNGTELFNQPVSSNGQIFFDAGTDYAVLVYRVGGLGPWEFETIPAGANSSVKKSGNGSAMFFGYYASEGWWWARVDGGTWFKWEMIAVAKVERSLTMDVNHVWGHTTPARGFHTYEDGDSVSLSAAPDPGYSFIGWTGDSDCSDGQVTMTGDRTCVANFELIEVDHTLTMSSSPPNAGTTSPGSGTYIIAQGGEVPLTTSPAQGFTFTGWTGDSDCSDGQVTMTGDRSCTAEFALESGGDEGGFDFGGGCAFIGSQSTGWAVHERAWFSGGGSVAAPRGTVNQLHDGTP